MEAGLEASQLLRPAELLYPFGAHVRGRRGRSPRPGTSTLKRYVARRRLRSADQPGDRRRTGARRRRAGHRPGAVGRGGLRRERPAGDGVAADYAMPRADGLPDIEVLSTVTPSPHHPLGVKGDRRGGHDRVDLHGLQRGDRRAGAVRREVDPDADDARARVARASTPTEGERDVYSAHSTTTAHARSPKRSSCSRRTRAQSCSPAATA